MPSTDFRVEWSQFSGPDGFLLVAIHNSGCRFGKAHQVLFMVWQASSLLMKKMANKGGKGIYS